ncbi:MAG: GNAT family N-acetyltransferase [Caulobacter sp.]|nr:GNAT family N-acetyltransferase [Caulobacter sp.]
MAVLRPATAEDAAFLAELFAAGARELYGAAAAVLEPMIAMQHRSQVQSYASAFPDARDEIILDGEGRPAGRLLTDTDATGILVVDIAVAPSARRQGLARAAMDQVLARAQAATLPVTAQIMVTNTASQALFAGLGFAATHEAGAPQIAVRWAP